MLIYLQHTANMRSTCHIASRARYESYELFTNCIILGETEAECHIFKFLFVICGDIVSTMTLVRFHSREETQKQSIPAVI